MSSHRAMLGLAAIAGTMLMFVVPGRGQAVRRLDPELTRDGGDGGSGAADQPVFDDSLASSPVTTAPDGLIVADIDGPAAAGDRDRAPRVDLEPNDTLLTAVDTGLTGDGTAMIMDAYVGNGDFPERDVDIYRFEVPPDGPLPKLLAVEAEGEPGALDGYLRVFDGAGQEIANNDDHSYPDPMPLSSTYLLVAGTYYIGVSASGNAYYDPTEPDSGMTNATEGAYDLTITVEPSAPLSSQLEPNDDFATATPVGGGQVYGEFIGDGAEGRLDLDIYQLTLDSPAIIEAHVWAEQFDSILDPMVSLRSSAGTIAINDNADLGTYDAHIEAAVFSAGDYYLVVSGAGNYLPVLDPALRGPGSVGYYDLFVAVTPLDDPGGPLESNDSILEATSVALAGPGEVTLSAYLGDGRYAATRGDVDVYEVEADEGAVVVVDVDAAVLGSELDSVVVVFDDSGRVLAANDNDGEMTDSLLAVEVPDCWWWPPQYPPVEPGPVVYVMVLGTRQMRPPDPLGPDPYYGDQEVRMAEHIVVDAASSTGAYEITLALDNCCTTGHGPGCGHPTTEACVCAIDPYCCEVEWDEFCVEEVAGGGCGTCPSGPGHNCCDIGHGAGCSDPDIEACVCQHFEECCEDVWDAFCTYLVWSEGCGICPHDCCVVGGPGCSDPAIRACVCADEPDCCEVEWDLDCVWHVTWLGCGTCERGRGFRDDSGESPPRDQPRSQRVFATSFDFPPNAIIEINPDDGSVVNRYPIPEDLVTTGEGLALLDDTLFYLGTGRFPKLYWLDPDAGDVLDAMILWSGSGYYGDIAGLDGRIFVTDILERSLHELDPQSLQAIRAIDVGAINDIVLSGAMASLAHPDRLYVADAFEAGAIYAIDPTTGQLDASLSASVACPCNADFDGDGDVDDLDQMFFDDCDAGDGSVRFDCQRVDLDCDGDRDADDQAILDCQYNGPGVPPHEDCCPDDLPPVPVRATALGASGSGRLYVNDWRRDSIEVYDQGGALLFTWAMDAPFGAIGGQAFFLYGDADDDGDVDLFDYALFTDCLTGPEAGPVPSTCRLFDAELDGDVDLQDFAALQSAFAEGL